MAVGAEPPSSVVHSKHASGPAGQAATPAHGSAPPLSTARQLPSSSRRREKGLQARPSRQIFVAAVAHERSAPMRSATASDAASFAAIFAAVHDPAGR